MAYDKTQQTRISFGKCKDCGLDRGLNGTSIRCRSCADKIGKYANNLLAEKRRAWSIDGSGHCSMCGKELIDSYATCVSCRERQKEYYKQNNPSYKEKKRRNGICLSCSSSAWGSEEYCRKHLVSNILRNNNMPLGMWEEIWLLLENQEFKCYYTGIVLNRNNWSIDHKTPKSRGGSNNIDNLVWCDRQINSFKNDLTEDEFIGRCELVVSLAHLHKNSVQLVRSKVKRKDDAIPLPAKAGSLLAQNQ